MVARQAESRVKAMIEWIERSGEQEEAREVGYSIYCCHVLRLISVLARSII